jgi:predicted nucleotide-binding protein
MGHTSHDEAGDEEADADSYEEQAAEREQPTLLRPLGKPDVQPAENRRVFITHGKNRAFVDTIKELLAYGEMDPVVSVEHETVSLPVPDKVINDMRSCGAAIIHVDVEQRLVDQDGNTQMIPNPNVLIEIGAAMALYGRRFILLVREGIKLPSNLQGLYEVRYSDDKLDAEATIRLLKAIKDIKNHPLPSQSGE